MREAMNTFDSIFYQKTTISNKKRCNFGCM